MEDIKLAGHERQDRGHERRRLLQGIECTEQVLRAPPQPRETQIARAAMSGATSREIAARLFISEKTVERHLGVVYRKLGIRRRVELAGKVPLVDE